MLKTDRCVLVEPRQQDYESLKDLCTDAEVRRYLGGRPMSRPSEPDSQSD
jgi:hypothetical protein